jgi:hypothetical protein
MFPPSITVVSASGNEPLEMGSRKYRAYLHALAPRASSVAKSMSILHTVILRFDLFNV